MTSRDDASYARDLMRFLNAHSTDASDVAGAADIELGAEIDDDVVEGIVDRVHARLVAAGLLEGDDLLGSDELTDEHLGSLLAEWMTEALAVVRRAPARALSLSADVVSDLDFARLVGRQRQALEPSPQLTLRTTDDSGSEVFISLALPDSPHHALRIRLTLAASSDSDPDLQIASDLIREDRRGAVEFSGGVAWPAPHARIVGIRLERCE